MHRSLMSEGAPVRAKAATRGVPTELPFVVTPRGRVPVEKQYVLEERIERGKDQDHITRHLTEVSPVPGGKAKKKELNMQELSVFYIILLYTILLFLYLCFFSTPGSLPSRGMYPKEVVSVTSTIAVLPDQIQTTKKTVTATTKEVRTTTY